MTGRAYTPSGQFGHVKKISVGPGEVAFSYKQMFALRPGDEPNGCMALKGHAMRASRLPSPGK